MVRHVSNSGRKGAATMGHPNEGFIRRLASTRSLPSGRAGRCARWPRSGSAGLTSTPPTSCSP